MLFKKIKINTINKCIRQIYIFNYLMLEYYTRYDDLKRKKHYTLSTKKLLKNTKNTKVFYLKINRRENWAFLSLQQWINVINDLNADFYIICDNENIKKEIYKKIRFKDSNVKIIKSFHNLKSVAKNLVHPKWVNAAIAHMTTFYHSKCNNIKNYWNIDADDTMFCFSVEKIIDLLSKAEEYAKTNNLNCISLDMWRSRSNNIHWSFGITYTQNNIDYIALFKEFQAIDWQKDYAFYNTAMNIDWFFNYLTQYRNLKTYSFYPENGYFIHWGDLLVNVIGSSICLWHDGILEYPILNEIAKNKQAGTISISKDCEQIDLGLSIRDGLDYLNNKLFNFDTNIRK